MNQVTKVFYISVVIAFLFIAWGVIPESVLPNANLSNVTSQIQGFLTDKFGWFYLLSTTGFVIFAIYLVFSKYGKLKLGKPEDEPEYPYITWFAMLFSAGMGIGLVFWGAAEPLSHFHTPAVEGQEGQTPDAAYSAMKYTFFHWGIHPWAVYATLALALAFFKFRKNAPGVISTALVPLLGEKRIQGPIGITIDSIAVFATIFGVATSLGLGALQISSGLSFTIPGLEDTFFLQLIIIVIVTFLFMISAMTGLNKGIKYLSNTNIVLAILLLIFVIFAGPTNFIMDFFTTSFGGYIRDLPYMSFRLTPFSQDNTWIEDWTIFYWAWWISWAPFVGTFIARVSRGRTIREFVLGVMLVPTVFGALWFSAFGGTTIGLEYFDGIDVFSDMSELGTEVALFSALEHLPLGGIMSAVGLLLISTFFITSADSATFVLGMQTTNGSLNPSRKVKFTWGIIQAGAAAVLLWQGGLGALQTAAIISAFPFAFILILICFSLMKAFKEEEKLVDLRKKK
ncbi:glycine/betaine ABC transporter permease [Salimicrobium jeotgali]|uniref:Choline/carnitine/betaine transporter n=1 Tax=Salimicrobium jeotgali TaxID=1230341 RepID=K2FLE6_9BACI|nr:BCCT family transporter [Salimicrobium jeotgali]AKG04690.1 glycine/betaine ABC transporter permease [Salimicrobium jeotgali]EKE31811.1 choline/carnitine/betaine transporter [Salimicrobium jeotgali]MBM7696227.1 glycine betaine transporter [Salimicrobium jeotgali]